MPLAIADQQQHIDLSERLLATVEPGQPATLYWSQAEPVGLVMGYSQKHAILNPAALAAQQIPVYHRRAGGTAVLVGPQLLSLDVVFAGSALACLAAALMLVSLPRRVRVEEHAALSERGGLILPWPVLLALLPAVLAGVAWYYMGGVYSAMWVLYITALGGSPLVAGLSVSIYSLPVVLFSGAAGRLADRFGIRSW